jgi:Phospholipase_D-nuclease N-terminal
VPIFSTLWDVIWTFFWIFAFIAYLMTLFSVIGDLFRNHALAGGYKALWTIGLVFIPFLTVLLYLIFCGKGMNERAAAANQRVQQATSAYVRDLAGTSPADDIAKAKALLDSNAITQAEFDALKAKALA